MGELDLVQDLAIVMTVAGLTGILQTPELLLLRIHIEIATVC
jgi:hypothetical protein